MPPMSSKKTALLGLPVAAVAGLAVRDVFQRKHSLLRAFPVIGHGRYAIEKLGPELRQYIIASNDAERPFSRDQRSYIYSSAKGLNTYFGFGTDNDVERVEGYPIIKHRTFTTVAPGTAGAHGYDENGSLPCAKVLGAARGRRHAFRPESVVNVSAMSYGSLSGPAIEALNRGAAMAGCLHNTGEGGCRTTTSTAVISSSRSGRATSAAATTRAVSTSTSSSASSRADPSRRSSSS